jgi:hypothetical protein
MGTGAGKRIGKGPEIVEVFGLKCHTPPVHCELMFDTITATRTALETLARDFEPRALSAEQAVRAVTELGAIRRLVDGLIGKTALRVEETTAYQRNGRSDRDAAQLVGHAVGADSVRRGG